MASRDCHCRRRAATLMDENGVPARVLRRRRATSEGGPLAGPHHRCPAGCPVVTLKRFQRLIMPISITREASARWS
jgi:hypothetical protein